MITRGGPNVARSRLIQIVACGALVVAWCAGSAQARDGKVFGKIDPDVLPVLAGLDPSARAQHLADQGVNRDNWHPAFLAAVDAVLSPPKNAPKPSPDR